MESTKFTKWEDEETNEQFYSLELPDGTKVTEVSLDLGNYLHQLEQKLK